MIDVTMYSTRMCPFCVRAQQYLAKKTNVRLTKILIGDHHVGGYDELVALDRAGKLESLLEETLPT